MRLVDKMVEKLMFDYLIIMLDNYFVFSFISNTSISTLRIVHRFNGSVQHLGEAIVVKILQDLVLEASVEIFGISGQDEEGHSAGVCDHGVLVEGGVREGFLLGTNFGYPV